MSLVLITLISLFLCCSSCISIISYSSCSDECLVYVTHIDSIHRLPLSYHSGLYYLEASNEYMNRTKLLFDVNADKPLLYQASIPLVDTRASKIQRISFVLTPEMSRIFSHDSRLLPGAEIHQAGLLLLQLVPRRSMATLNK